MYGERVIDHLGINCADWEAARDARGPNREVHVAFAAKDPEPAGRNPGSVEASA
jgi:hypothetical protein